MKNLWRQYSYAIILLFLSCSIAVILSVQNYTSEKYVKVTISEGDSLWKISKQYSSLHSLSHEEFVNWVKKHNQMDGDKIYPGEKLLIPVSKTSTTTLQYASAPEK